MPDKKGQNLADLIYGQPTHGDSPGMQAGGLAKALRALTAVEKEANKAKFLEPSKTQMRLYHGTTATEGGKGQEAIRRIKPSKEGSLGSGVYLTPSTAHSSTYSGSPNEEAIQMLLADKHSADIGRQFLQNQQAGNVLPGQIGGNMLPVYAQVKNPLILEGKGDPMVEALVKLGVDEDKAARMVERAYENKGYIGREVETRARAAGYDGLMQYRNGDLSEVVVYNPNAVKSAIGNQGTYDITKPGLSEAKGGAIHMEKGGAAFGVFPQMKPRRSQQDPEAAKQVPVDLARGFAAGALGMPGDVESLIRLLPGLSEETILPTSEDILKRIPGGSDTPASRAASGLGILGGGFYTGPGSAARAVSSVAGALPKAAKEFVQAAGQPAVNVIKPKGGNWLTGSVEKSLAPLKSTTIAGETPAQRIPKHEQLLQDPSLSAESRAAVERHLNEEKQRAAIDNWVDRNLTNYVKKEMATPEDPVRRLAEQRIVHISPDEVGRNRYKAPENRRMYGGEQMGRSEAAQAWEDASDVAIYPGTVGELKRAKELGGSGANNYEPWMEKVDPKTPLNRTTQNFNAQDLGFNHIIDVLREDLATGRIRPEQLNKVSMEQAVRRTYEYDQELAKKMWEATAAARADLPVYKEYPEKYRWIELNRPGAFASESEAMGHSVRGYEPPKGHPDWTPASGDSGSESYGHGGWEAIKSGKAKVYSLVDEKGQPHVTVEVGRDDPSPVSWLHDQPQSIVDEITAKVGERPTMSQMSKAVMSHPKYQQDAAASTPHISQIKGKQNAAPKKEYLPFVQDFVKSGQWSDVGDITNANLEKANWTIKPQEVEQLKSMGIDVPDYVTPDERLNLIQKVRGKSPEDMKHGGPVHISNNPDTMRLELAGGGTLSKVAMEALSKARLLREEMAAKAALQAQYAKEMEGVYTKDMPTLEQWKASKQQTPAPTPDPALEKEANLKKFAGKSKVTDEQGNPLVVYHGKTKGDLKGPGFSPEEQAKRKMSHSVEGAYYFSSSPNVASGYADFGGMNRGKLKGKLTTQGTVFPVYLKMENPLVIDAPLTEYGRPEYMTWHDIPIPEQFADKVKPFLSWKEGRSTIDDVVRAAKESGQYDGVIINNVFDPHTRGTKESATTYVTFEPTQIKSAIGNKGTYDPTDPDITKAAGGSVDRLTPQDMLYLTSHPDFAKMTAQQQREAVVNMGDRELSERLKGKMAEGGEVTIPDMTDGGKVIDGGPFKKGGKVQFTDNLDTMRLAVGRK